MEFDVDTSTKIIIGLVTAIAGAAMHLRSERVKNAGANANVANLNLEEISHKGQAEEILSLRERLNKLDSAFVAQAAQLHEQASRIAVLEASHLGVAMHVGNLLLCDVCTDKNALVLSALNKALDGANKEPSNDTN